MSSKSPRSKLSPNWKRPSDVMKIRRKQRTSSCKKIELTAGNNVFTGWNKNVGKSAAIKRRNPFKQSNSGKKQKVESGFFENESDQSPLFSVLNQITNNEPTGMKVEQESKIVALENILKHSRNNQGDQTNDIESLQITPEPAKEDTEESRTIPPDWSLKTKMRFLSTTSFSWCHPLKSFEEATGLTNFVRCKNEMETKTTDDLKMEFHKYCQYWMHPNLPWLKLFPRIVPDNKIGKQTILNTDEDIKRNLLSNWTDSFASLFHLLRAGYCPYFYVCAHQFTALFRAPGYAGQPKIHALLSPTTRGFREGLRNEGIEFTMPLRKKSSAESSTFVNEESCDGFEIQIPFDIPLQRFHDNVASTSSMDSASDAEGNTPADLLQAVVTKGDDDDDDDDDEDLAATDEGASTWLQSMGLDKAKFPTLDPKKIKIQREGYRVLDNRPESLVFVEDSETQALFNFLLNCRHCFANTGPQAGIPPTLLAPVAFKGATLQSLKVKQSTVKQQNADGSLDKGHLLELVGPILPHTIHNVCQLLQKTQHGQFTTVFSVHEQSTAFNIGLCEMSENEDSEDITDSSGLHSDVTKNLTKTSELKKVAVRELICSNNLYSWT